MSINSPTKAPSAQKKPGLKAAAENFIEKESDIRLRVEGFVD